MSTRHLDALFDPTSVALIGATARPDRIGATAWTNLRLGGYQGRLLAVNPKYRELDGHPVHARVKDLPVAPELAVICTPPDTVAGLVDQLGERGTQAVVVLSRGLSTRQRQAMLDAARRHLVRIRSWSTRRRIESSKVSSPHRARSDQSTGISCAAQPTWGSAMTGLAGLMTAGSGGLEKTSPGWAMR